MAVTDRGEGRYRLDGLVPGMPHRYCVEANGYRDEYPGDRKPILVHSKENVEAEPVKLRWWGKKAVPDLLKHAANDQGAVWDLGNLGPEASEAVPTLTEILKGSPDKELRRLAAQALGKIGTASHPAVPALIAAVQNDDPAVARYAAESLGLLGDIRAIEPIEAAVKGGRLDVPTAKTALWKIRAAKGSERVEEKGRSIPPTPSKTDSSSACGADQTSAWGNPVDGLRCRWMPHAEPIVAGTALKVAMEVENISTERQFWQAASELTWKVSSPPQSAEDAIMMKFESRPGKGARPATGREVSEKFGVGRANDEPVAGYFALEPGGRMTLYAEYPWRLATPGRAKIGGWLSRYSPSSIRESNDRRMECPPLTIQVAAAKGASKPPIGEARPAADEKTAWGQPVDGLRCRWVSPVGTVPAGTAPAATIELENVSDKPIRWDCESFDTLNLEVSGLPTVRSFTVDPVQQGLLGTPAAIPKVAADPRNSAFAVHAETQR